jgi:hypothetical protein
MGGNQMASILKRVMAILFVLLFTLPLYASEVVVPNFSFEEGSMANGYPISWPTPFGTVVMGKDIAISDARASHGKYSLRVDDQKTSISLGLRSAQIPATVGMIYTATADVYVETGMAQFYLEFWNNSGQRIDTVLINETAIGEWRKVSVMKQAPVGTTYVTLLVYGGLANVGVSYYDNITLRMDTEDNAIKLQELVPVAGSITPIVQKTFQHEEALFGYNPWYTRNEVTFDKYNRPYIRYRTDDLDETGFIHTLRNNRWVELDFTATIKANFPSFQSFVKGGGWDGAAVVFDADDDLYTLVRIRLNDGKQVNLLLYSSDYGDTFKCYQLPSGVTSIEQRSGHSTLNRPPLIGLYSVRQDHPAEYASYNFFHVLQPVKDGDELILSTPVLVTMDALPPSQHSGGASFAASSLDKAFITWAEATDPQIAYAGAPTYVATYDIQAGKIVDKTLLTYASPVNDSHNTPGIVMDSKGYLHVISGAHGANFYYAQSLAPYNTAEWTKPIAVLETGFAGSIGGSERGRQTYLSFLADADDTLHIACRQWRQNKEVYFDGSLYGALSYQQKPAGQPWGDAQVLIVPPTTTYSIFYHKMSLDREGRLYLSYNFRTNVGGYNFETPVYQYRAVITSADLGKTWQLATSQDFANGIFATAPTLNGTPGRIEARVVDKQGNPLAGVTITAGPKQTVTSEDGRFVVDDIYVNQLTLTARKQGYRSWYSQVVLPQNEVVSLLVELTQDAEMDIDFGALFSESWKIGVEAQQTNSGWRLNFNNRLGASGLTLRFDPDEHYWAIRFEGRAVQPANQQLTMRTTHLDGVEEQSLVLDNQWRQYEVEVPTDLKQFNLASSGTGGTIEIRNMRLVK